MKTLITLTFLILISYTTSQYNRRKAINYAFKYLKKPNHKCGSGSRSCTPYGYFGKDACGYKGEGGDCANFVSQCLLAGGHKPLKGGQCRGIPCGKEEIGALKLGLCLKDFFGHKRECGKHLAPPNWVQPGDVLIYHANGCGDGDAHAVIVTVGGKNAKISAHSREVNDVAYTYMGNSKPFLEWIHIS